MPFRHLLLLAALAVVSGCGPSGPRTEHMTEDLGGLPFDSLRDWRSYADLVAVVEITGEETARRGAPELGADATYERSVTATVDRVLWKRSSGPPPGGVAFEAWGAERRDGDWIELAPERGPRVELGERYVVAFLLDAKPGPQTSTSVLEVDDDGRIHATERASAGAASIDGVTLDELERKLLATKPDPIAERYEHLPPRDRYGLTLAAREPD